MCLELKISLFACIIAWMHVISTLIMYLLEQIFAMVYFKSEGLIAKKQKKISFLCLY